MKRLLFVVLAGAMACSPAMPEGNGINTAGNGINISTGGEISVDQLVVPYVDGACAAGEVVKRTDSGWGCATPSAGADLSIYARRDQLSGYAQRSELAGYAQRSELSGYAQRSELAGLARASDVNAALWQVDEAVGNIEYRLDSLESFQASMKIVENRDNNGSKSCVQFCNDARFGVANGTCVGAKVVTGPDAGRYMSCDYRYLDGPGATHQTIYCYCSRF